MKALLLIILIAGIVILFSPKLPGNITIRGSNWTLCIPVLWMLLVSIILSLIFSIFHH